MSRFRRWIVIALAVLLSAQYGWAAAAAYCQHETRQEGQAHFGHHAATHAEGQKVAKAEKKSASGDAKQLGEADHGHCHFVLAVIGAHADGLHTNELSTLSTAPRERVAASHIPEGLDRPDWQRA